MAGIGHSGAEASERLDAGGEGTQRLATMGNSPQARLQDTGGEVGGKGRLAEAGTWACLLGGGAKEETNCCVTPICPEGEEISWLLSPPGTPVPPLDPADPGAWEMPPAGLSAP